MLANLRCLFGGLDEVLLALQEGLKTSKDTDSGQESSNEVGEGCKEEN